MAMLTDSSSKLPVTTVVVSIPTIAGCMQLLYFYLYKKKKNQLFFCFSKLVGKYQISLEVSQGY